MDLTPSGGSLSLVAAVIEVQPGSEPLIGEGLHAQFPSFWWNGGAADVHSLGPGLPRYYMN